MMPNPLQQTVNIVLLSVQEVHIHNSLYYQITYRLSEQAESNPNAPVQEMRINPEAFYPNPQAGDKVAVNLLMGNVMGAQRLSPWPICLTRNRERDIDLK